MNVISSPSTSGNGTGERVQRVVTWLALASLVSVSQVVAQEQPAAQEQTAAVLKLREVNFAYRSRVAPLSCSALEGRVASILRALGARDDVQVRATGCDAIVINEPSMEESWEAGRDIGRPPTGSDRWDTSSDAWETPTDRLRGRRSGREQSAHVRIRAMMPIEVTPEVLEEIRKDKSRRDLISRVQGNRDASLNDPIVFPAQRQIVALSQKTLDLEPEECELVDQMATSTFKELGIRVVRRGGGCERNQVSRFAPQITVEALLPVLPTTPQLTPAEPESEPAPSPPADSGTQPPEAGTATPPQ